jgi:AcrR family transcriptional regulator
LWAADRRQQLLRTAAELLESHGVDGVRIPDVAERAGVSRAVVYRFFPNRQAILLDLIEEFGRVVQERVEDALTESGLDDVEALLGRIFSGICDTVSEQGAGVWRLLNSAGPDPEIESVAQKVRTEITLPWFPRVESVTHAPGHEAVVVTSMIASTIPAVVELWLAGQVDRDEAITYLERGTATLIREFTA